MNVVIHQRRTIKFHLTSFLLLAVMLFSAVTHSHEFSATVSPSIEQLDCKLCQQLVDPPQQKVKLAKITLGSFSAIKVELVAHIPSAATYRQSNPRAPPRFN